MLDHVLLHNAWANCALLEHCATLGPDALDLAASDDANRGIGDRDSEDWTTVGIVLAQLVHHGNEHRAQATTILGSQGRPTPKIGAWTYGIANGVSKNDGD